MEKNFYTVKKVINGKEYTGQFSGISVAIQAIDNSYIEGTNNTSVAKMAKFILDNVIVDPVGLTVDDFDNMDELNEVITFGREVMQGDFRNKKDKGTTEEKSKE